MADQELQKTLKQAETDWEYNNKEDYCCMTKLILTDRSDLRGFGNPAGLWEQLIIIYLVMHFISLGIRTYRGKVAWISEYQAAHLSVERSAEDKRSDLSHC